MRNDSRLGVKLTPRPRARGRAGSKRKMARCAGHGFDDVADEGDSGCCTKHPVLAKSKLGGGGASELNVFDVEVGLVR